MPVRFVNVRIYVIRQALTPRDFQIFALLERYRFLRSTYLYPFVGGASETRFKERLGHLYHEGGYLDRPVRQWQFAGSGFAPIVYENTRAARQALDVFGNFQADQGRCAAGDGAHISRQFAHTLMVCEILASIELAARTTSGLRFVPWAEILAKAPQSTRNASFPLRIPRGPHEPRYVVPDGIFGLEYASEGRKAYRFFALEADRATMPVQRSNSGQTSYFDKMTAYRDLISRQMYRAYLGVPNFMPLTVTLSNAHLEHIQTAFRTKLGKSTIFLFKAVEELYVPEMSLLTTPWERVGYDPLSIT